MEYIKFTESEIQDFYLSTVKKDEIYLKKYDILSNDDKDFLDNIFSHPNYRWDVRDYSRVRTIFDFKNWIEKYQIDTDKLAYTYEDDPELKLINYKSKFLISYDVVNGDLHKMNNTNEFDIFLFNQTIEHLYNPFICIQNIYNSLKIGGYVFTSVPMINIPHSTPIHFNGFNTIGLSMLFKTCGFEVLEVGQWGNYEYISKLFETHNWPGYSNLSENGIKNEERNIVSCWILAKKII
jgi:hypothetical protein